ncbi:MAG: hypothetical protein ABJA98_01745 [Acidobacteriota bacterium]
MAITGTFQADFSQFQAAVAAAETKLVSFETGSSKVTSALGRMETSLSGRKLIQDASLAVQAVENIGGVSKLTEAELQRLATQASAAADKMRAMGIEVPPGIQRIAGELKEVGTAASGSTSLLGGMAAQLTGMFTIGAVVAFGREVLAAGDTIMKMSDQTGIGTGEIQKLQYVAGQSGTSIESLVGAVQNLQLRLGDEGSGAAGALKKLNINFDDFKKLSAYEQMTQAAEGIKAIKDPTEQVTVAGALFGKTWKEILPAIKAGMQEVGDQAPIMADATVKSLDRVGDALAGAHQQATAWGGGVVLAIEGAGFAVGDFLSQFNPEHFGTATSTMLKLEGQFNKATEAANMLKGVWINGGIEVPVLKVAEAYHAVGLSAEEANRLEKELTRTAEVSIEVNRAAAAAEKERADKWIALLKEIAKVETDTRGTHDQGLLGLSAADQKASQLVMDTWLTANAAIEKSNAEMNDELRKVTMDTATYQDLKIWEAAEAQIAAFKGTAEQQAQYADAVWTRASLLASQVTYTAKETLTNITDEGINAMIKLVAANEKAIDDVKTKADAAKQAAAAQTYSVASAYSTGDLAARAAATGGMIAKDYYGNDYVYIPGVNAAPTGHRAEGGPVAAGASYLVGERGPELYTPGANGFITPNGSGGGATVVNHIYVNGTAADVARQVADRILRTMKTGARLS